MSKLTDRISYIQGLAEGMKLNQEKDANRLIMEILSVLGDVGDAFDALAESHGELSDYVEKIDEDLADLEANLYDDEDEDLADDDEDEDGGLIEYECPHCGTTVEIDADDVDFGEECLCPECGKELFPELSDDEDEDDEDDEDDK